MLSDDIVVVDDFLPEDVAIAFSRELFDNTDWIPEWNIEHTDGWLWHASLGNDREDQSVDLKNLRPLEQILWKQVKESIFARTGREHKPDRFYTNSHTYGQEGYIHTDDGDVTFLYYPCRDWPIDWEGGTSFYNEDVTDCIKYVSYKFNRAIFFKASIPHRAMPVSRSCYNLRASVVFKTSINQGASIE